MHGVGALANITLMRRDYRRAARLFADVEALAHELADDHAIRVTVGNRAYLAIQLGDFERALTLSEEALVLSRKIGDSATVVTAALNLALAAHALGKERVAETALGEALKVARARGLRAYLVDGLIIAAAVVVAKDPRTAAHLLAAATRAQTDLAIELDPAERDLRDSVETHISHSLGDTDTTHAATGDLDVVLDTAARQAVQSLEALATKVPT